MPRRFFKKLTPRPEVLHNRWYLKPFRSRFTDPRLWAVHRRSITASFGVALAICFVPLPVHMLLGVTIAVLAHLNVPVMLATLLLVNPLTVVPVYYLAYRVGAAALGYAPEHFAFELSWNWLQYGLGPVWRPFLAGCLICGVVAGTAGWFGLESFWRWHVRHRYRLRPGRSSS